MRWYRCALLILTLSALSGDVWAQGMGMGFGIDDGRAKASAPGAPVTTCQQGAAKFNGACNSALAGMMG